MPFQYHIEKNTVQETLVIPLFARKTCSERYPSLFSDPEAERVCASLDYDFASREKKMRGYRDISRKLGLIHRQMLRFCDNAVNMKIVKISFREG